MEGDKKFKKKAGGLLRTKPLPPPKGTKAARGGIGIKEAVGWGRSSKFYWERGGGQGSSKGGFRLRTSSRKGLVKTGCLKGHEIVPKKQKGGPWFISI